MGPLAMTGYHAAQSHTQATQTTVKPMRVLTKVENGIATALRVVCSVPVFLHNKSTRSQQQNHQQQGSYATLGALQSPQQWQQVAFVVGGVLTAVLLGFGYKGLRDTNKRWRYQRALKEVEKMQ